MNAAKKPSGLLALMIVWYVCLLFLSGVWLLFGMAFGSEAYRGKPMPVLEWLIIGGPFVISTAFLVGTILLWKSGKTKIANILWASSGILVLAAMVFGGMLGI